MMQQVIDIMRRRGVFASVDIHSNTGCSPHYGCVNVLDNRYLHLATLSSRTVVYFTRPRGVRSLAMSRLGPVVTLECGKKGERHSVDHTREYLDACLHLSALPKHLVVSWDMDLFHTVAQVKIPEAVGFAFPPGQADILLSPELERFNFRELSCGTALGCVNAHKGVRLEVRDEQGRDVADRYFFTAHGELRLKLPVMPAILARDEAVIRQDCLCYLMERYDNHCPQRQ